MLNIPELEQRWLRYKIKSTIPYLIILTSLIIITIVIYIIVENTSLTDQNNTVNITKDIQSKENITDNKQIINTKIIEINDSSPYNQNITPKNQISQVYTKENTIQKQPVDTFKLSPSMNFMQSMQNYAEPYYNHDIINEKKSTNKINSNKPQKENEVIEVDAVEEEVIEADNQIVEDKPKKIVIQRRNTENDIKGIIKRFKKNNNPALSLFIAKKYYELANYHQSYNYALITNQINKDIEASWLIFAKSLVKLGKKDMAIRTLQEYVKSSHSGSAKILLNEIRSGKFKWDL